MAVVLGALALGCVAPAAAAAGTWGSGDWPYLNGTICQVDTSTTAPLVSWNAGAGQAPAFLSSAITSATGGKPPLSSVGPQSRQLVTAGTLGFATSAQIAAAAYLIQTWGSAADPARVAEVSELIMVAAGDASLARCLDQDGLDSAEADRMWTQATELAGPYTVNVTPGATALSVQASVTSAAGYPVPGLPITFSADGAVLSTTATTTDADGQATTSIEGPSIEGSSSDGIAIPEQVSASVTAATTLSAVTVTGAAPAVYAGAPTIATATGSVALNPSVDPSVATTTSLTAATVGTVVSAQAVVTGMQSHQGTVTLTIAGPLPVDQAGGCAALTNETWTQAIAADTTGSLILDHIATEITGDTSTAPAQFVPPKAGCYSTSAVLVTSDASPNVTVTAPFAAAGSLTVLAAVMTASLDHAGLTGPGPIGLVVTLAGTSGSRTTLSGTVSGPVSPQDGTCTSVSGSAAPRAATIPPAGTTGDGSFTLSSNPVRGYGCYFVTVTAAVTMGDGGQLQLPVAAALRALVLTPTLQTWTDSTWVLTSRRITASVQVLGSLTQPGQLTPELRWLPPQRDGCVGADFTAARILGRASAVRTHGDGRYTITSAPATRAGCYSLVPVLSLDADQSITASGAVGFPESIFLAGPGSPTFTPIGLGPRPSDDTLRLWFTGVALGLLLLAATGRVVLLAWWDEHPRPTSRHAATS